MCFHSSCSCHSFGKRSSVLHIAPPCYVLTHLWRELFHFPSSYPERVSNAGLVSVMGDSAYEFCQSDEHDSSGEGENSDVCHLWNKFFILFYFGAFLFLSCTWHQWVMIWTSLFKWRIWPHEQMAGSMWNWKQTTPVTHSHTHPLASMSGFPPSCYLTFFALRMC